ncbi:MAG: LysM peptidoglycan-binding domain-containing protein [Chromatiales bacterium]|nr:LysM peptidoglycan-binding domain-containing protein [Chromatiales bacterium]
MGPKGAFMARHISILSLLLSVYLMSAPAWGLALGDIDLKSNLNQPFRAEITVDGANRDDVTGLTVQLASRAAFDRLGLDYPEYLQGFNLRTELRPDGNAVVIVTSSASVTEPFVTILVEAIWARGRLLREYTVFLDPPTFVAPAPAPAPVQAPSTATESRTTGTVVRQPPPPAPRAAPADQPAGQPFDAPGDSYRVQRNDTLWKIADRYRPDTSVSVNQMMMAIYEANPNAFMGQNINLVRAGSILRIPDRSAVTAISASQANAEVARQYDEWRSGSAYSAPSEPVARLELRPPSEESSPGVGGQPVTGDAELTKENVELRDELAGVRDELEETQRLLQLRDEEMAQLQQRLQAIEEAESEVVAPVSPAQPEELAPQPEPAAETETPPAPVQPAARLAQPAADESLFGKVISFVTAPLFLILLGLGVIVAALLAVLRRRRAATEEFVEPWDSAGQAADDSSLTGQTQTLTELPVRARGEESIVVEEGVSAEDTGSLEIPVFEPRTDATGKFELPDFETTAETTGSLELPTFDDLGAAETPAEPLPEVKPGKAEISAIDELSNTIMERLGQDQGDPIGEADFHMAYGLYDQAADVVRSALNKAPERRDLRAKLAEIYFVWGNKDQFLQSAQKLFDTRDEGADSDWDKILIMGKQIAPEEPIFSGELRSSGEEPVDLALEATAVAPPVDLSLAEEDQGSVDLDFGDALETGGDTRETPVLTDTGAVAEEKIWADAGEDDEELDFDFSGDTQESPTLETVAAENATLETPTIESVSLDTPTMETPTLETPAVDVPTIETPTLETPAADMPTMETPTLETPGFDNAEELADTIEQKFDLDAGSEFDGDRTSETAEIDLDDLGLDVNLDDSFLGPLDRTGQAEALAAEEDEDLTAAEGAESTGIRKVDFDFSEETADEDAGHAETETLAATDLAGPEEVIGDEDATILASALPDAAEIFANEPESVRAIDDPTGIDLDLGDMIDAAESAEFGDTVEQPGVADAEATASADGDLLESVEATGIFDSPGATGIFESPESTGVLERPDDTAVLDLDIGEELRGVDDDPTATEVLPSDEFMQPAGDAVTMSEIGTKLDLARAYMDMGDPDGARSILEEVLDEGDEGQRADAERLIKSLS